MPDLILYSIVRPAAILKDADLQSMSSKKVRLQLEEKLNCDLLSRKKEIDELVLSCINPEGDEDEEEEDGGDDGDSDYSEEEAPKKKRESIKAKKPAASKKKRKYASSDDEDDSAASESDGSDYKPTGYTPKGKKKAKKAASDDDSDDDYKAPKKAKAKKVVNY